MMESLETYRDFLKGFWWDERDKIHTDHKQGLKAPPIQKPYPEDARLSDLVEGEAPEDLCRRIEEVLGDCQALDAYKATLARTIELAGECGRSEPAEALLDEEAFGACVESVRRRLRTAVTDPPRAASVEPT